MKTIVRCFRNYCLDYLNKDNPNQIIRLLMYKQNNSKRWIYSIYSLKGNLINNELIFKTLKLAERKIFKLLKNENPKNS